MKYTSNALWPKGTLHILKKVITNDNHETESAAAAVCASLKRHGFGGRGTLFPVRTWVEIKEES